MQVLLFTQPVSEVVWQVRVSPPTTEGVQAAELLKPLSVVLQVMASPATGPLFGVQDAAVTKPLSVVWQVRVSPAIAPNCAPQDAALTKPVSVVWQVL